jgi:diguanylate cyclase (GGDEF)-like protein
VSDLRRDRYVRGIVVNARDITERVRLEDELSHQAFHDTLTGLANRALFRDRLDQVLARSARTNDVFSLLLFDLDGFKQVNDSLGHTAGDDLLRSVADVFRGRLRESDIVGRLGGDEFAVILLEADPVVVTDVAYVLRDAIAEILIETPDGSCSTTASIGIAPLDATPGLQPAELLARADAAMYRAKRAGGNRVVSTLDTSWREDLVHAAAPATER